MIGDRGSILTETNGYQFFKKNWGEIYIVTNTLNCTHQWWLVHSKCCTTAASAQCQSCFITQNPVVTIIPSLSLFTFMHWIRKWQPTPVFLPGESQGWEPGGLPSMGLHRVGHDWCDLAAGEGALHLLCLKLLELIMKLLLTRLWSLTLFWKLDLKP